MVNQHLPLGRSAQAAPRRRLMHGCSHDETGAEFAADFARFWPDCFRAFALAAGALMPAVPAIFASAPSTGSTRRTGGTAAACFS